MLVPYRSPRRPLDLRTLLRYFVRGCLVLVPLLLTLYAIYFAFTTIDGLLGVGIPGVGFILTISLITVAGALTSNVVGARVFEQAERLFMRLPVVKLLYGTLRDVIAALSGQRKSFERPVLVRLSKLTDARVLGFVTSEDLAELDLEGHVSVYVPQSFNFAGNLMIVPRENVAPLDIDTARAMAFIVSAGLVSRPTADATSPTADV